jgi:hypothetical protein
VRLAGGGIDACASLLSAAQPAAAHGSAAPGCSALLAVAGGAAGAASP